MLVLKTNDTFPNTKTDLRNCYVSDNIRFYLDPVLRSWGIYCRISFEFFLLFFCYIEFESVGNTLISSKRFLDYLG